MAMQGQQPGGQTIDPTQFMTPRADPNYNPGGPSATPGASPYVPGAGQPPPTPPSAPGPDSISIGATPGYTPDYTSAIQNDPGYAASQTATQQAAANAQAQRQAALRAQVIQYGGLPDGFKDPFGDIDQATLDAAKNNQYSTLASLKKNYDQSVSQFQRALAARGALQSGDLNYGQNQIDTGYGQSQYDAGNQFGSAGQGILNAYTGVLGTNAQNLAQAIQAAAANAYNDPANKPVTANPGTTASRNAALSSQYGIDVYDDGSGKYYTRDGNPWVMPSASPIGSPYGTGPYSWGGGGKV